MADSQAGGGRSPRGSGPFTVHLADELEVYFNEVAHGRPVGFVASPKWRPRADVYESAEELVVQMDIAGMQPEAFRVEVGDGVLTIAGERTSRGEGKRHYHAMEVQIGPFERRLRLPVPVDTESLQASYDHGFLEVRLRKLSTHGGASPHSVKVTPGD